MASSDESAVSSGRRTRRIAIDPIALVEQVVAPFALTARERGIALRVRPDVSIPARLHLDGNRTREALAELIEHALARVTTGEVRIDLVAAPYDHVPGAVRFRIAVIDSAPPIQHDPTLAISRHHAEQLGGQLIVAFGGEGNGGVTLELPAEIAPHDAPLATDPWHAQQLASCRVLIGDDGGEISQLLAQTLRSAGAEVELLEVSDEALAVVDAATADASPFDVVILDHRFAEADASMVARALRNGGFAGIIMLFTCSTESAQTWSRPNSNRADAPYDAWLSKPLDFPRLVSELGVRFSHARAESAKGRVASKTSGLKATAPSQSRPANA